MGRPDVVDDLLRYAPIALRDYVLQLEEELTDVDMREGPGWTKPVAPPTGEKPPGLPHSDSRRLGHFAGASETSRKAALDNYPRSGTQREQVLLAVAAAGPLGTTSDEISTRMSLNLYSVKPRLIELREGGWVEQNGRTRRSRAGSQVDVYVATEKGRAAVKERHDS